MEKKQTAVQWLVEQSTKFDSRSLSDVLNLYKEALQMEREQIEEAFKAALPLDDNPDYMADKYYNSKYGK